MIEIEWKICVACMDRNKKEKSTTISLFLFG